MRTLKTAWLCLVCAGLTAALLVLPGLMLLAQAPPAAPGQDVSASAVRGGMFNIHLQLPEDSRIDYLRLYYYDAHPDSNSSAWLTAYNGAGNVVDLTHVASSGASGYGTTMSPLIGHEVDTATYAYVLNWQANDVGADLMLCGLRIAYVMDGTSLFRYVHVAGTALRPREGGTAWRYGGGGCLYQPRLVFLPLTLKGH